LPRAFRHPSVLLAHNLFLRISDIDNYSQDISVVLNGSVHKYGEIRVGTLLVGYFSACKALLDAAAISLSTLYSLTFTDKKGERPLRLKQRDFSKTYFRKALEKDIALKNRFEKFKLVSDDVVSWRDVAVHRVPTLVVQRPNATKHMEIKMAVKPEADMLYFMNSQDDKDWMDPLDLHRKWRPLFIELCEEVCRDIRTTVISSSILNRKKAYTSA
ncbi:MAG: hypothetical protein V1850_05615, partial [Candidatus Bathyarchaeota archaeon]